MTYTYWVRTVSRGSDDRLFNLTAAAAQKVTFSTSGGGGVLLEHHGGEVDPDTRIVIHGTPYRLVFERSAALPTARKDGAQQVPDQYEGSTVYIVAVQDYPTAGSATRLAFLPDEDASQAEMDAFGKGAIDLQPIDMSTTGAVSCAEGTWIETPGGSVAVEDLQRGDLVETLDDGPRPIVWISRSRHKWPGSPEAMLPIRISAHAFGLDRPERDLIVSPHQKLLLSLRTGRGADDRMEVLGAAKAFTNWPGVRQMSGKRSVSYYHILLARHQILLADNVAMESFFPGQTALGMLTPRQCRDVVARCPMLASGARDGYGPSARPVLTVPQTRRLAGRVTIPNPALMKSAVAA